MSIIGITATRQGCTPQQRPRLASYVRHPSVAEVHHGDCTGGDAEADEFAYTSGRHIVIHPPTETTYRAFCHHGTIHVEERVKILEPKPYLERNHDIVDACTVLVAVPHGPEEARGSGTWATIRYARRVGKPIIIIWPDGTVVKENAA